MNETQLVENKAAALRQAFDLSFALPPPPASPEVEDLLTIRVAGNPYAIRLRDIAGMVAGRKVVPVPSVTLDLLGLAGMRGGVVPVFGLLVQGQAVAKFEDHDFEEGPAGMVLYGTGRAIFRDLLVEEACAPPRPAER